MKDSGRLLIATEAILQLRACLPGKIRNWRVGGESVKNANVCSVFLVGFILSVLIGDARAEGADTLRKGQQSASNGVSTLYRVPNCALNPSSPNLSVVGSRLKAIEVQANLPATKEQNLLKRLQRLELKIFGALQVGTVELRLQRLEQQLALAARDIDLRTEAVATGSTNGIQSVATGSGFRCAASPAVVGAASIPPNSVPVASVGEHGPRAVQALGSASGGLSSVAVGSAVNDYRQYQAGGAGQPSLPHGTPRSLASINRPSSVAFYVEGSAIGVNTNSTVKTIDCKNGEVTIAANGCQMTLRGSYAQVTIKGDNNKVVIAMPSRIKVEGNNNNVIWQGSHCIPKMCGSNNRVKREKDDL